VFHIIPPPPHCAITAAKKWSQLIYRRRRRCSFHLVKNKNKIMNKYTAQDKKL